MENQAVAISDNIHDLMMLPLWVVSAIEILDILSVLTVVIIAHYIFRSRAVGGVSILICVYLSIIFSLLPMGLSLNVGLVGVNEAVFYYGCQFISSLFVLFAAVNGFRFVRHTLVNRQAKLDAT